MSIRIISGKYKGFKINVPNSAKPTLSRSRQSLFDILTSLTRGANENFFENKTVLDCFSGSGALGLEALSRGADYTFFVEFDRNAVFSIRSSINKLKIENFCTVINSDVLKIKHSTRYTAKPSDIVFIDAPYGQVSINKTIKHLMSTNWICNETIIVTEENAKTAEDLSGYHEIFNRRLSSSLFRALLIKDINNNLKTN